MYQYLISCLVDNINIAISISEIYLIKSLNKGFFISRLLLSSLKEISFLIMTKAYKYIIIVVFSFLIQVFSQPVYACVEDLKWGMDLVNVENHLGVSLIPIREKTNENLFEVKEFQISGLPVEALRVRIEKKDGLKQLAYEIDNENMTEVLAGLRYRFGSPVGTNVDIEGGSPQQQWIWHTGEDVIVAVKSDKKPFLLSYRPSLLDPSFL